MPLCIFLRRLDLASQNRPKDLHGQIPEFLIQRIEPAETKLEIGVIPFGRSKIAFPVPMGDSQGFSLISMLFHGFGKRKGGAGEKIEAV